jgi:cell division protein FtsN
MESRNILLVVICICAFLVIIFGIGFVWSMPDRNISRTEESTDNNMERGMDIFEHVRDENDPPGLDPTEMPSEITPLVVGEEEESTDTVTVTGDTEEKDDLTAVETGEDNVTIQVPRDKEEQKEDYTTTWIAKPDPTPRPARATNAPRRKQRVTEYWIQAAAFESRSRADALRDRVAEHGFYAQIKTTEKNGSTLYRVRIGPYEVKKEAEKQLEWLKVLNGMKDSFISEVYTQKYIN